MKSAGTLREAAAEFLGTFVLITFGVGVVAQVVLSGEQNGQYLSINLGWGLAVVLGIYTSAGVSGAHLNPAVTLALAVHRGFAWSKVVPYVVAQMAGAVVASALIYGVYYEALEAFDGGYRAVPGVGQDAKATAGIWATYPQKYLSTWGGLFDQVVGTAMLVLCVFALGDSKNQPPSANLAPLFVGLTVVAIGMTLGYNCGYAINPARDLGPRLFTAMAGWGPTVFSAGNNWWWVPVVGPCIGGVLGGLIYDGFVGKLHPSEPSA